MNQHSASMSHNGNNVSYNLSILWFKYNHQKVKVHTFTNCIYNHRLLNRYDIGKITQNRNFIHYTHAHFIKMVVHLRISPQIFWPRQLISGRRMHPPGGFVLVSTRIHQL